MESETVIGRSDVLLREIAANRSRMRDNMRCLRFDLSAFRVKLKRTHRHLGIVRVVVWTLTGSVLEENDTRKYGAQESGPSVQSGCFK